MCAQSIMLHRILVAYNSLGIWNSNRSYNCSQECRSRISSREKGNLLLDELAENNLNENKSMRKGKQNNELTDISIQYKLKHPTQNDL